MNVLVSILGGVVFFGLIIVSVLLHEAGHFIPAKIFGVKVTEFFAGFGPRIWSRRSMGRPWTRASWAARRAACSPIC